MSELVSPSFVAVAGKRIAYKHEVSPGKEINGYWRQ